MALKAIPTSRDSTSLALKPHRVEQPLHMRKPARIFVNSMSDLFHTGIPRVYVDRVFDVMERANQHTYQVLTKRSSPMRNFVNDRYAGNRVPGHIWLGVTVEDRSTISRIQHLKQANATVRFVSFEPLLGPIGHVDLSGIHWVIVGGESGPGWRPMEIDWARELRDQCVAQGVAFFFKQYSAFRPHRLGRELDGCVWNQYPDPVAIERAVNADMASGSAEEVV